MTNYKQKSKYIYDCILLHTPKFNQYIHPLNKVGFVNIIATGLFSIADLIDKNGYSVKIVHIGIEKLLNPKKTIKDIIIEFPAKIYGISLQWHFQAYDAIELARVIKEVRNDSFVVLGGLAASFFKDEIMEQFDFIDAIISGEGEIPFLKLVENIDKNRSLNNIPNLIYRDGNKIIENKDLFYANNNLLSSFDFSRMELLHNYKFYTSLFFFTKYPDSYLNKLFKFFRLYLSPPTYITTGRGCPYNCTLCAGGYNMKKILKRDEVGLRDINSIMRECEHLISLGFKHLITSHYYDKAEEHYIKFIREYAKCFASHTSLNFDVWNLPSLDLIDEFSMLKNKSIILFMVYSLSEKIRSLNNIHNYDNSALVNIIEYAKKKKVRIKVIIQSGLPFEDQQEIEEIRRFYLYLIKRFNNVISFTLPTELAPGSPMYMNPEKYNIVKKLNTFMDFYNVHKKPIYTIGYQFNDISEKQILKLKCDTQCFINPIYGKYICKIMHKLTK